MKRVLFVCLGNICRSPTAHGVFQHQVETAGETRAIQVDSCGTGGWHVGEAPDRRATAEARKRGYDLTPLRARQLESEDFDRFDYIIAMDAQNLADIRAMAPADYAGVVRRFLDYPDSAGGDVPDPYYGGDAGFAHVLDLVEDASRALLREMLDER